MTKTTDAGARSGQDSAAETKTPETVPVSTVDQDGTGLTDPSNAEEEIGGPKGPEPTRYGDWEKKGRCIDF